MRNINFFSLNLSIGSSFSQATNTTIEWTGRLVRILRAIPSSMNKSSVMTVAVIATTHVPIYTLFNAIANRVDRLFDDKSQSKERSIRHILIREALTGMSVFIFDLLLARILKINLTALVYFCITMASAHTIVSRLLETKRLGRFQKEIENKDKKINELNEIIENTKKLNSDELRKEIENKDNTILELRDIIEENKSETPWKPSWESFRQLLNVIEKPDSLNREKAFKIFELKPGATSAEINKARHRLMRCYHPDRNRNDQGYSAVCVTIASAYEMLT